MKKDLIKATVGAIILAIGTTAVIKSLKSPSQKEYLERLLKSAEEGNKKDLEKLCGFIKNEDQKDLNGFEVPEDLRASCAELTP